MKCLQPYKGLICSPTKKTEVSSLDSLQTRHIHQGQIFDFLRKLAETVAYTTSRTTCCTHYLSAGDKEYQWTKYAIFQNLSLSEAVGQPEQTHTDHRFIDPFP
jgi:hypothetical protein